MAVRGNKRACLAEFSSEEDDAPLVPTRRAAPKRRAVPVKKPSARKVDEEDDLLKEAEEDRASRSFKTGQRVVCPPMGDPGRAFYESLLTENPKSIIAVKWCIEHGCLMGSQLKQTLKTYAMLKSKGAFKQGKLGGVKKEFL